MNKITETILSTGLAAVLALSQGCERKELPKSLVYYTGTPIAVTSSETKDYGKLVFIMSNPPDPNHPIQAVFDTRDKRSNQMITGSNHIITEAENALEFAIAKGYPVKVHGEYIGYNSNMEMMDLYDFDILYPDTLRYEYPLASFSFRNVE